MRRPASITFQRFAAAAGLMALLLAPARSVAQGAVNFSDFVSGVVFSHIYGPQASTPDSNLTGNIATAYGPSTPYGDFPTGTTSYQGPMLGGVAIGPTNELDFTNGFLWTAQLWAASGAGQPASSLQPVSQYTTTLRTGPSAASAGFMTPISFSASDADPGIPFTADSGVATCQLRVWYNGGGTITSWDLALASDSLTGASAIFTVSNLASVNGLPPSLPANLAGLQSFSLYTPPEWTIVPQFIQETAPLTVPQGSNVTLSVLTSGAMTYQWQFDGTNLADNARISGSQSNVLAITGARMGDAGAYEVLAGNLVGNEHQLDRPADRDASASNLAIGHREPARRPN